MLHPSGDGPVVESVSNLRESLGHSGLLAALLGPFVGTQQSLRLVQNDVLGMRPPRQRGSIRWSALSGSIYI